MIDQLFDSKPTRFSHTLFFPEAVKQFAGYLLEFFKGAALIPILKSGFQLTWWGLTLVCVAALIACLWSPLRPATRPGAFVCGLLLFMHPNIALLALATGLVTLALTAKPHSSFLVAVFIYPVLNWSFIVDSYFPVLGLVIAGLLYVKWGALAQRERPWG